MTIPITTIHAAREAAIHYLRSRNIYVLDRNSQFRYTPAEHTDVRRTIEDERLNLAAIYDAALREAGRPHA